VDTVRQQSGAIAVALARQWSCAAAECRECGCGMELMRQWRQCGSGVKLLRWRVCCS
jgi:hypothetical protein